MLFPSLRKVSHAQMASNDERTWLPSMFCPTPLPSFVHVQQLFLPVLLFLTKEGSAATLESNLRGYQPAPDEASPPNAAVAAAAELRHLITGEDDYDEPCGGLDRVTCRENILFPNCCPETFPPKPLPSDPCDPSDPLPCGGIFTPAPFTSAPTQAPTATPSVRFFLTSEYYTYDEAVAICPELYSGAGNAMLASVESPEEWAAIQEAAKDAKCNGQCGGRPSECPWYWLGGSKINMVDRTTTDWQWVDGSSFEFSPPGFGIEVDGGSGQTGLSGWGEPTESCYSSTSNIKGNGWHDAPKRWKMRAVCKVVSS